MASFWWVRTNEELAFLFGRAAFGDLLFLRGLFLFGYFLFRFFLRSLLFLCGLFLLGSLSSSWLLSSFSSPLFSLLVAFFFLATFFLAFLRTTFFLAAFFFLVAFFFLATIRPPHVVTARSVSIKLPMLLIRQRVKTHLKYLPLPTLAMTRSCLWFRVCGHGFLEKIRSFTVICTESQEKCNRFSTVVGSSLVDSWWSIHGWSIDG